MPLPMRIYFLKVVNERMHQMKGIVNVLGAKLFNCSSQ